VKKVKIMVVGVLAVMSFGINAEDGLVEIEVYRSPSCSCCGKWVEHLKKNQFIIKDHVIKDVQAIKNKYGVSSELASCHTALVNGYVVEGHVPASDIKKMLKLKPSISGISVPGMPVGTPGMEVGDKKDPYDVIAFDKNNKSKVFSSYK
jgi:hypothetical protein